MRLIFFGEIKVDAKIYKGIFSGISQTNRVGLMSYFMTPDYKFMAWNWLVF